ncbi:MAG: AAA family ATPase [Treponemataceae bacterium]|nr:AAA family ATPase [Treponemataceae bacterium]
MKKISIFNHKGGVSKTTTTFNLGCALARLGKRILLVDADSQCNLTLYSMGYTKYEEYCENNNLNNIYGCLVPAFKSQPKLIDGAECYQIENNLFLLPGSLERIVELVDD